MRVQVVVEEACHMVLKLREHEEEEASVVEMEGRVRSRIEQLGRTWL